jgi:hypothetical protein
MGTSPTPVGDSTARPTPPTFSESSAEEFVRAYYATLNDVLDAPKSDRAVTLAKRLMKYTATGCECRQEAEFFVHHTTAGDRFSGGRYTVHGIHAIDKAANTVLVVASYSLPRIVTRSAGGRAVDIQQKIDLRQDTFVLAFDRGSWQLMRQIAGPHR